MCGECSTFKEKRNSFQVLVCKTKEKRTLGRPWRGLDDVIENCFENGNDPTFP
jgi:hypothetical protein